MLQITYILKFDQRQLDCIVALLAGRALPVGVAQAINELTEKVNTMSAQLDNLTREVSENNEVIASAERAFEGLAQQIRDLKEDPAALEKLATDLDAQSNRLATAVAANTPSA